MPPRLSALDASFRYLEQPTTPMHVGGVLIVQRPRAGFAHGRLVELIEQRDTLVPRDRRKVRHVPGDLALSVRGEADVPSSGSGGSLGDRVTSFLVDPPVAEPSPLVRLHRDAMSDVDLSAGAVDESLDELVGTGG